MTRTNAYKRTGVPYYTILGSILQISRVARQRPLEFACKVRRRNVSGYALGRQEAVHLLQLIPILSAIGAPRGAYQGVEVSANQGDTDKIPAQERGLGIIERPIGR